MSDDPEVSTVRFHMNSMSHASALPPTTAPTASSLLEFDALPPVNSEAEAVDGASTAAVTSSDALAGAVASRASSTVTETKDPRPYPSTSGLLRSASVRFKDGSDVHQQTQPKQEEDEEGTITGAHEIGTAYNYLSVVSVFLAGSAAGVVFALPSRSELKSSYPSCSESYHEKMVNLWCYVIFLNLLALSLITTQQYFLQIKTTKQRVAFAKNIISRAFRRLASAVSSAGLILFIIAAFLSAVYRLEECKLNQAIFAGGIAFTIMVGSSILLTVAASEWSKRQARERNNV